MTDSRTTEVLIIGAGAAGLSAAVAAHDSGAKVTVIEKGAKLGGTAASPAVSSGCPATPVCRKKAFQTAAKTRWLIFGHWIMAK